MDSKRIGMAAGIILAMASGSQAVPFSAPTNMLGNGSLSSPASNGPLSGLGGGGGGGGGGFQSPTMAPGNSPAPQFGSAQGAGNWAQPAQVAPANSAPFAGIGANHGSVPAGGLGMADASAGLAPTGGYQGMVDAGMAAGRSLWNNSTPGMLVNGAQNALGDYQTPAWASLMGETAQQGYNFARENPGVMQAAYGLGQAFEGQDVTWVSEARDNGEHVVGAQFRVQPGEADVFRNALGELNFPGLADKVREGQVALAPVAGQDAGLYVLVKPNQPWDSPLAARVELGSANGGAQTVPENFPPGLSFQLHPEAFQQIVEVGSQQGPQMPGTHITGTEALGIEVDVRGSSGTPRVNSQGQIVVPLSGRAMASGPLGGGWSGRGSGNVTATIRKPVDGGTSVPFSYDGKVTTGGLTRHGILGGRRPAGRMARNQAAQNTGKYVSKGASQAYSQLRSIPYLDVQPPTTSGSRIMGSGKFLVGDYVRDAVGLENFQISDINADSNGFEVVIPWSSVSPRH